MASILTSTLQVTSMKTGPASTISRTFTRVTKVTYDLVNQVVKVDSLDAPTCDIDISGASTFSDTISSGVRTIAIS